VLLATRKLYQLTYIMCMAVNDYPLLGEIIPFSPFGNASLQCTFNRVAR